MANNPFNFALSAGGTADGAAPASIRLGPMSNATNAVTIDCGSSKR
jgi:hypothetical protein